MNVFQWLRFFPKTLYVSCDIIKWFLFQPLTSSRAPDLDIVYCVTITIKLQISFGNPKTIFHIRMGLWIGTYISDKYTRSAERENKISSQKPNNILHFVRPHNLSYFVILLENWKISNKDEDNIKMAWQQWTWMNMSLDSNSIREWRKSKKEIG